ncbi:germinal-center associated nuclear protein isoform X1 [Vanessa tameamea]|uniref:Germinal-center associated nuclear protein isoform X1 n=2 Tax=Vanessa tameamea TaxID=334116 RepID=A0A8B8IWL9_VANTA|nr:germinal-center associated nuclear protein [Vanessa tameamea]
MYIMSHYNNQNITLDTKYDDNKQCIVGTCSDMCPREEVTLRKKEKLVHVLEVTGSGYKLIKSYSRSAASANMAVPRLLRPYPVLFDTIHYLLIKVSNRSDVPMSVLYDFLNDRLRAVRQDMTIQRLPPEECIVLLEPMIRFYVYFGYRLCEHPLSEYDPVLNKKYLLECLKWYLSSCDLIERSKVGVNDVDEIIDNLSSLNVNRGKDGTLSCDRILVESLYILCNLDDIHPLYRYLNLPKSIKRVSILKLTYNIALAHQHRNYIRMLQLSTRLCPLTFSVLCLYLPSLQKRALQSLSTAFNSKHLTVPVRVVQKWLAFNSEEEVRSACKYYGLEATDGVFFNKSNFKHNENMLPPKKYYKAKILSLKLEDVLSYTI